MTPAAQLTIAILSALTPTIAVFLGVLIQRQDTRDLRTEIGGLRKDMHAEVAALRKDMQGDIADLRRDLQSDMVGLRNQVHAGMLMIHERAAKVEARQGQ